MVVIWVTARSAVSLSVFLIVFRPSRSTRRLKICWIARRVAAIRPPAAGVAAPSVRVTATAMPISSMRNRPISTHASSFAPSMSQPHSSTSLPSSSAICTSPSRGASSPAATRPHAPMKASATPLTPAPPKPAITRPAASYASSRGIASRPAMAYHRSATSQVAFSSPSGQSKPTTHSSASYAHPGTSNGQ
ncbi:hypothetical protein BG844_37855 [Couchioplanes caeruleus subsp. caeruleus]|uniref:Uncharacterized protein n=1 Tax=Couchioplanes caeruleus subsp. caeruleus TaxID=56427 RepID=A0A1K0GB46_9ACTN|nr:hypothetical protein BG844_37855 [Couchioplanes caeruleus subsp. caeruleus]